MKYSTPEWVKQLKEETIVFVVACAATSCLAGEPSSVAEVSLIKDEMLARAYGSLRTSAILSSENSPVPPNSPKYYLSLGGDDAADGRATNSAWKTLERLNREDIPAGAYVLFERGGVWRGTVEARQGVTYTAYGKGPKPCIFGSPEDGAVPSKWKFSGVPCIWSYHAGEKDVGALVFDCGAAHAVKVLIRTDKKTGSTYDNATGRPFKSWHDLHGDLRFWHDYKRTGNLYLFSEVNPGERFRSIEFSEKRHGFAVRANCGVTIDNIAVRYCGAHGVAAGMIPNQSLTVRNCVFEWIGGSIQGENLYGRDHPTRYGNGVEIYGGCDGYVVSNCLFRQIYDAGVTHQVNLRDRIGVRHFDHKNVTFVDNVFEKCNYSIEYFLSTVKGNVSRMENVLYARNLMFDAGCGLCEQRPDSRAGAHVWGSFGNPDRNRAVNFTIADNVFCASRQGIALIVTCCNLAEGVGSESLPYFRRNVVIGKDGQPFGVIACDKKQPVPFGCISEQLINAHGEENVCILSDKHLNSKELQ